MEQIDQAEAEVLAGFQRQLSGRVELHTRGGVALIRMNHAVKRNALDAQQIEALELALNEFARRPDVRVGVLTGTPQAFCAGGDIPTFLTLTPDTSAEFTQHGHDMLRALENGRKPLIAAVAGHCIAGGLELALACDFILAAESARLGMAEVDLGIIPGWGGTVRMAKALPVRLARQLVLTSERLTAQRALGYGLVNEVHPDAALLARAVALAERIAQQPPLAVQAAKAVMNATDSPGQDAALKLEALWTASLFGTTAVKERVQAWAERAGKGRGA